MYIRVQIQLIIIYQYAICLYSTVLDEDFCIKLPLNQSESMQFSKFLHAIATQNS